MLRPNAIDHSNLVIARQPKIQVPVIRRTQVADKTAQSRIGVPPNHPRLDEKIAGQQRLMQLSAKEHHVPVVLLVWDQGSKARVVVEVVKMVRTVLTRYQIGGGVIAERCLR